MMSGNLPRMVAVGVPALAVTGGLFFLMAQLISEEFQPQDVIEVAELHINPKVEETIIDDPKIKLKPLEKVETPPAPPIIERAKSAKPPEAIVKITGSTDVFKPKKISLPAPTAIIGDASPTVRVAPQMPPKAQRSGHCMMRFNVSAEGVPYDVEATSCSERLFARPSVRAVQQWKYAHKIEDGRPVGRSN
ncbi:MAG: energy transducer TonB, partial [Pseudomonadota bacterium]